MECGGGVRWRSVVAECGGGVWWRSVVVECGRVRTEVINIHAEGGGVRRTRVRTHDVIMICKTSPGKKVIKLSSAFLARAFAF